MTQQPLPSNPAVVSGPQSGIAGIAEQLVARIRSLESVAVAYSGGVDSAVVARASVLALGHKAVAVTAVSPSLAISERRSAAEQARSLGIRHVEIATNEFESVQYRANTGDRCFFCKDTLYRLTGTQLKELGVRQLVNGTNTDDLGDHRPGLRAAVDHGVQSPLVDVGCDKSLVRELARYWGLAVAEKPAAPCLSSRIAYGIEVTEERVRRIDRAEAFVRRFVPDGNLRVRCEANELARIEVDSVWIATLVEEGCRSAILAEFRKIGFRSVTVDLTGFQSGNLNHSLPLITLNTPETNDR